MESPSNNKTTEAEPASPVAWRSTTLRSGRPIRTRRLTTTRNEVAGWNHRSTLKQGSSLLFLCRRAQDLAKREYSYIAGASALRVGSLARMLGPALSGSWEKDVFVEKCRKIRSLRNRIDGFELL